VLVRCCRQWCGDGSGRVARAEIRASLTEMATRFPAVELADEHVEWNQLLSVRGPKLLHLRLAA
jgi:cytochrome P450